MGGAGSGFIVDSSGYIITNGHVIFSFTHPNVQDDLYARQLLFRKVSEEQDIPLEYVVNYGEMDSTVRKIFVQFGESVSSFDIPRRAMRGRTVGLPSPASEKDVAVIKIDCANLTSLELGKSEETSVSDRIFAIGYPGAVMEHPDLSEETGLEPSVTMGIISAKRKTKDGSPCLQSDVAITNGNSGGPVINEKGEVVGITTFGTMGQIHGFNFIRPSELIEEFLEETGVRNVQILRRIDNLSEMAEHMKLLTSAIDSIGWFKCDECTYNVKGYCRYWLWKDKPEWGKFKKIEGVYRIKTSRAYCALCHTFKKKGKFSAQEQIDALVSLMKSAVSHKLECAHNEDGFCTQWHWTQNPTFYDLDGSKIKTKETPEGTFNIKANYIFCAYCDSFEPKKPKTN